MKRDRTARWRFWVLILLPLTQLRGQTLRCSWPGLNAKSIEGCPAYGCAVKGTPEATANQTRNRKPSSLRGPVRPVTVETLERLQKCVELQQGLAVADRTKFQRGFCPDFKDLGEGVLVDVYGFIVGTPRIRRRDPANCLLIGDKNNSIRINIAQLRDDPEYDSFLVEIIPLGRWNGKDLRIEKWNVKHLRAIKRFMVHVTGQLFYDNKHVVNADPDDVIGGEPKRMSLWEIHPVTNFEVCKQAHADKCFPTNRTDWIKLEDVP